MKTNKSGQQRPGSKDAKKKTSNKGARAKKNTDLSQEPGPTATPAESPGSTVDAAFEKSAPEINTPQSVAVDAFFRTDAALRRAITDNLKSLRGESEAVAARVEKAWKFRPSQLSTEELGRRHYVAPGSDPGEVLESVIMSGVDALRSAKSERTLSLRNTAELKKLIKNNREPGNSLHGVVELGPLIELIRRRGAGPIRGVELASTPYAAEAEAEAILGAIGNGDGDKDGAPVARRQTLTSNALEAEELVKDKVNTQMNSATAPESQLTYSKIPNSADEDNAQKALLQSFELREGPTDVTSYHDFHTLQIAFGHVWTEILDGQLEPLGRELYREYVKLKDFSGSGQPDLKVGTYADLRRLIEEVKRLSQIVQEDLPGDLRGDHSVEDGPKGQGSFVDTVNKTLDDSGRLGLAAATGGLSVLVEAAVNEIINAGKKPVLNWAQLDGRQLPGNRGTIIAMISGGAPTGRVEIALQTDRSHRKILEFQPYDTGTGRFINHITNYSASNWGHPEPFITPYVNLPARDMESGVIEFASQETETIDLGRYVLADLHLKLVDGTRVIFYWRD